MMEACLKVICQAAKHCGQYQKENGHVEGNISPQRDSVLNYTTGGDLCAILKDN